MQKRALVSLAYKSMLEKCGCFRVEVLDWSLGLREDTRGLLCAFTVLLCAYGLVKAGVLRRPQLLPQASVMSSLTCREALQGRLLLAEQDEGAEDVCKPLSCGWEITDTLCVGPVFTPASIM